MNRQFDIMLAALERIAASDVNHTQAAVLARSEAKAALEELARVGALAQSE